MKTRHETTPSFMIPNATVIGRCPDPLPEDGLLSLLITRKKVAWMRPNEVGYTVPRAYNGVHLNEAFQVFDQKSDENCLLVRR